jgi:hypothetical protein
MKVKVFPYLTDKGWNLARCSSRTNESDATHAALRVKRGNAPAGGVTSGERRPLACMSRQLAETLH